MAELKFFRCAKCKNIVEVINGGDAVITCCGEAAKAINPNTVDAAVEKHLPVVSVDGNTVTVSVGSVTHPMLPEHFIGWIYLLTNKTLYRTELDITGAPEAKFVLADGEKPVAAYEYCNLHGIWKTEVK